MSDEYKIRGNSTQNSGYSLDMDNIMDEILVHQNAIEEMKRKITSYKERMQKSIEIDKTLLESHEDAKYEEKIKKLTIELDAYKTAIKPYEELFDVDFIEEDNLVKITLSFKDAKAYPIYFFIDAETKNITDFMVSSICTKKQEVLLKKHYETDKNMATVLNTLRAILVKKKIVK